jgi:phosphatidate phosphatase APP1
MLVDLPDDDTRTAHFQSYGGWASTSGARVMGRVVEGLPPSGKARTNSWKKRASTAGAFARGDVDDADVLVTDVETGVAVRAKSDDEGFYDVDVPGPWPPGRRAFRVELIGSTFKPPPIEITLEVHDPEAAGLLAIVDIDDTLTETGVTSGKWDLAWATIGRDAGDMRPFPGSSETLRALAAEGIPILYLSASPVELAPRLSQFLRQSGFPEGPLMLRYWPRHGIRDPRSFKRGVVDRVLADFPNRKLLLFGDNGEKDPELFAAIAKETGRVEAAYVRTTLPVETGDARYAGMVPFDDWRQVACDAALRNVISETAAERITTSGDP